MQINRKLAISLLLLFILVPAVFIYPLYERANEVEKLQHKKRLEAIDSEEESVKKVCEQQVSKVHSVQKTACGA